MDKIEFTIGEFKEMALESMKQMVLGAVDKNRENINSSLDQYFKKSWVHNKANAFENAFDWALESCFREGIQLAMEGISLKQLIADKAKEMLTDDVIKELAHKKVKASLGL